VIAGDEASRTLEVRYAVRTHTGLVRDHNEDDFIIVPDRGLFVVADGMGGHAAGKIASEICVRAIADAFAPERSLEHIAPGDDPTWSLQTRELEASLRTANRAIFTASHQKPEWGGMGTTAVGIRLHGDIVSLCHAGDSRCYLLRDGSLAQVTDDHSLSNFLFSLGRETEARLAAATMSNVIMRALGLEPDVSIECKELVVRTGDRFLLCSDGLSDLVSDHQIEQILLDPLISLDLACDRLVDRALFAGGRDNVTVLVVEVQEARPDAPGSSSRANDTSTVEVVDPHWGETTQPGGLRDTEAHTDPNAETPVPTG
jgi:protein phosphatase